MMSESADSEISREIIFEIF